MTATCWLWIAGQRFGYGGFWLEGKTRLAHRVSWVLHNGVIPEGMCVLHTCDTPLCVNPRHLFLGTYADNTKDCIEKGRFGGGGYRKLSNNNVKIIRQMLKTTRKQKDIAKLFNVDPSNISHIARNKTWNSICD